MITNSPTTKMLYMGLITLSAMLFTLSFPNPIVLYGIQGLGILSLVPAWYVLSQTYSIRSVYRYGMLFGGLTTITSYYWLTRFGDYSIWTIGGVSMIYIAEYGLLFVLIWLIIKYQHSLFRPLVLAILWTSYEYIKSRGFLGFPWTLLAQSVHNILPLIQIAKLTGTWGITFLLAYGNAIILEWLLYVFHPRLNMANRCSFQNHFSSYSIISTHIFSMSILLVISFAYGEYQLLHAKYIIPEKKLSMLLVQQNLDSWANIPKDESITAIMNLTKNSLASLREAQHTDPQIIVWSETSLVVPYQFDKYEYTRKFYTSTPHDESFVDFMSRNAIPLLTGTPLISERGGAFNSAVIVGEDAHTQDYYGKNQLVPFAEMIPFFQYQKIRMVMNKLLGLNGSWLPSGRFNTLNWTFTNAPQSIDSNSTYFEGILKIGVPICFEDSFSNITRNFKKNGAQLLVNISNVSWSKTNVAQAQQFAAAKFRSIETGLALVRSTNSGITSVIDPWGHTLANIPMFEENTLFVDVPLYNLKDSLYMHLGDFVGILATIFSSIYCIWLVRKNIMTRKY